MSMTPGGAVSSFRVLLEVMDTPPAPRRGESAGSLRVSRRCVCALRDSEDSTTVDLVRHGLAESVFGFLALQKGAYIHAIVAWRASESLCLNSFWLVPTDEVTKFRVFFRKEVELYAGAMANEHTALSISTEETPLRITERASAASADSVEQQPWATRFPLSE